VTTWTHRLARVAVRPLVGTRVTPNVLTTLRLMTGLLACAALLPAQSGWNWWAGWLWLVSAFLDRADGELARIGNMCSPAGHIYDARVDNIVNSAFFVALGIGARNSGLGNTAIVLGVATGAALYISDRCSDAFTEHQGRVPYPGVYGFDPDDLLYLLAPIVWLGWQAHILIPSCVITTAMALLTVGRLWHARRTRVRAMSPEPG